MDTHCEGVDIKEKKIQSYKESYGLLNLGGITQRHVSISGGIANYYIAIDATIEGRCQQSESLTIQNTESQNIPKWYAVCPGE